MRDIDDGLQYIMARNRGFTPLAGIMGSGNVLKHYVEIEKDK